MVDEDHLYGCFSPCGSPCLSQRPDVSPASESKGADGILALVRYVAPELHELSGESFVMVLLELGSFEALAVATVSLPPQSPASVGQ
jgi:hypothetical protein